MKLGRGCLSMKNAIYYKKCFAKNSKVLIFLGLKEAEGDKNEKRKDGNILYHRSRRT